MKSSIAVPAKDHRIGLSLFFLRAAPVRAAGAISAAVAAILLLTLLTLQSFQLSGEQFADEIVGSSGYALQTGTSIPLGASGENVDSSVRAAVLEAGGRSPVVQYSLLDGLTIEDERATAVGFEEGPWESEPFPRRLSLLAGHWPTAFSEVTVSAALEERYPIDSVLSFFSGSWEATVVGIAEDDFVRDGSTLYASVGTWNSLSAVDAATASRYGATATRFLYWTDGDEEAVVHAVTDALATAGESATYELLRQQVQSRDELVARGASSLIEFRLGSLIAPFLAALIGVLIAIRFINRIRAVMLAVGIARERTRSAAMIAIAVSTSVGLMLGSAIGVLIGVAVRPLLDALSEHPIGPTHDVGGMLVSLFLSSVIGGALGILLSSVRQSMNARERIRTSRIPMHYVALPVIGVVLAVSGWQAALMAQSTDQIIIAGICLAFAGVVLLPLILEALLLAEPASMSALLAVRRLRSDIRQSGWITASVSALVVVAFATTTLLTSAITTMNDSNLATVPPGQVQFAVPNDVPAAEADSLSAEVATFVGAEPVTFFVAEGGVDLLVGGTVVVESTSDFTALTGVELPDDQRELLERGGTVRTKQPDQAEVTFENPDGRKVILQAVVNDGLTANYRILDGFMLRSAAEANGINLVSETQVFLNLTDDQLARAESAPIDLGFDAEWLDIHRTPDVFSDPIEARLAAGTISTLAVVIMFFFVSSITRLLRPDLSTLQAVGAGRRWLMGTILTETGAVLIVATLGSALTAVVGMFVAITVSGLDLKLVIPWQSIGITIGTLLLGTLVAIFVSGRRLTNDERFAVT